MPDPDDSQFGTDYYFPSHVAVYLELDQLLNEREFG